MHRSEYAQMFRLEDTHFWFAARRDLLLRSLGKFPPPKTSDERGLHFLDVGCGTGATLDALTRLGTVTGLDAEPLALEFCRRRGHENLVCASATDLPFPDHSFGAVVALDVLEHIADDRAAFAEISRVLQPGGLLFLTVPAYPALWSGHDVALMHHRRYVAADIVTRLGECGLHKEYLTYTVSFLLPVVWAWRKWRNRRPPGAMPRADITEAPAFVNAFLRGLLRLESRLFLRFPAPFGLTVFAVARKSG